METITMAIILLEHQLLINNNNNNNKYFLPEIPNFGPIDKVNNYNENNNYVNNNLENQATNTKIERNQILRQTDSVLGKEVKVRPPKVQIDSKLSSVFKKST